MYFLERLANHILEKKSDNLKDLVVVLPNVRAKLFLTNYLKDLSNKAIFLPVCYSSQELMEKISGLKSADDYLLMSRLYNAYPIDENENLTFDVFINWGNTVLQDFKEVDHQLVDAPALFEHLKDIKIMESWNPDGSELSAFQKKYLQFCQKIPSLYDTFQKGMEKDELGHLGYLERKSCENLNLKLQPNSDQHFIIAGFNALTKAEEKIFNHIKETYTTEFIWDFDHYYLDNILHEAGHFARINKKNSTGDFNWVFEDYSSRDKEVSMFKCATSFEQSFVVSELLKNVDKQSDFFKTAIVLTDENMLLPVLQSLPESVKEINVTMGYSLFNSPYYSFFESLIKLFINFRDDSGTKQYGFYHFDIQRFLQSDVIRQLAKGEFEELIQAFQKEIRINKQIYIPGESLNHLIKTLLKSDNVNLTKVSSSLEITALFRVFIQKLDEVLNEDQTALASKINREFLLHHNEVIEQVEKMLQSLDEDQNILVLQKIWKHYSKLSKVQFTGEPLMGLQIMGLLESRNLDFDHVIVLNVNEGSLPSDRKYGSLIPNDLKKKFGMNLHQEKDAIFAYHFYRLLQRASKVDLLYSNQVDDLGSGEKSRFLIQLEKELVKYNPAHSVKEFTATSAINISPSNPILVQKTSFIRENIKDKLESGLSPSSLTTYLACPLDFYFKYIVGLYERETMIENLEADIMGNAIHQSLETLYKPFVGKVLTVELILKMKDDFEEVLIKNFERYINKPYLFKGKNLLSFSMAKKMMERFFENEVRNVKNNEVVLMDLEMKLEADFILNIDGKEQKVRLKGTVDRVERKNGVIHLVDYKTGHVVPNDTKIKNIDDIVSGKDKALQLLTYAWLISKTNPYTSELISASLYPLKSYNIGYLGFEKEGEQLINTDVLNEYIHSISGIVNDLVGESTSFQHNSEAKYCNYC